MNRWVLRVAGYAALMTDKYPPFRLDMGGPDPGSSPLAVAEPAPSEDVADRQEAPQADQPPPTHWSAGRVVAVVAGSLLFLMSCGLLTGGFAALVADQGLRDDAGFVTSDTETFSTRTYAVTSENLDLHLDDGAGWVPETLLGDTRITATGTDGEIFLALGPSAEVGDYLADVSHSVFIGEEDGDPDYRTVNGTTEPAPPADAEVWTVQAEGAGEQTITWEPDAGDWTIVLMNADGTTGVSADVTVGAELPALGAVAASLLVAGGMLLLLSVVLLVLALRRRSPAHRQP
jgi:hypothetical protein